MFGEVALEVICKVLRFVMKELWPVIHYINISFEGLYLSMILFSQALACLFAVAYLFIDAVEYFLGLC
jgi:hypothetical protein